MITSTGYSKDPNIVPEGIVVTFGQGMMLEQGGALSVLRYFEECMATEGNYWLHKCKNKPQHEVDHVYVVALNRLYCRCYFGGYESHETTVWDATGRPKLIDWRRIILGGPIEKPPFKRILKGFQGFRYATKLF